MKGQIQTISPKKVSTEEYRERLATIHKSLKGMNYKVVYEYEFDEKLNEQDSIRLMNFWNYRSNDIIFLTRFETIASNIKNS